MSENASWASRLRRGLGRTSDKLKGGIASLFAKGKLDQALLAELEEVLITADLGAATAARLTRSLACSIADTSLPVSASRRPSNAANRSSRAARPSGMAADPYFWGKSSSSMRSAIASAFTG